MVFSQLSFPTQTDKVPQLLHSGWATAPGCVGRAGISNIPGDKLRKALVLGPHNYERNSKTIFSWVGANSMSMPNSYTGYFGGERSNIWCHSLIVLFQSNWPLQSCYNIRLFQHRAVPKGVAFVLCHVQLCF